MRAFFSRIKPNLPDRPFITGFGVCFSTYIHYHMYRMVKHNAQIKKT
jgi:hypothetical protein